LKRLEFVLTVLLVELELAVLLPLPVKLAQLSFLFLAHTRSFPPLSFNDLKLNLGLSSGLTGPIGHGSPGPKSSHGRKMRLK